VTASRPTFGTPATGVGSSTSWPRVVHVIAPAPTGGAESVVLNLAAGIRRAAGDAAVVAFVESPGAHPFAEQARRAGIPVTELRSGQRRYRAEARALAAILKDGSADLVHTHVQQADLVGYWAARACGLPVVATVHGYTARDWKNHLYEWFDRRLLRRFEAVVCVAGPVRARLLRAGCRADRLHLIPNGYLPVEALERDAARAELGLGRESRIVGWVGRLSAEKGPDLFCEAVAHITSPDVVAVLVGDGPERASLDRRSAAAAGAGCPIRLLGSREGMARLLRAFDVLVLSSRTEGTPMILLEALAAGVPVVSFAVGGVPDVIDQASGWLVPSGDTVGLAAAVRQVLEHPLEAARRAGEARRVLETRFGAARWLQAIRAVYDRAIEGAGTVSADGAPGP
jgi:glycosyltransferase involved in cell wall biosynthesis